MQQADVRARYGAFRAAIGREQEQAIAASQASIAQVRSRYAQQYRSTKQSHAKLAADLRRAIADKDNVVSGIRRDLFRLHWEREKLRRELLRFQGLKFRNYLRRLVWKA
jgi:hypothetical protein